MNDPEAERCLNKANCALQNGDHKTAVRLAQKAKRMFPVSNIAKQTAADQIISEAEEKNNPSVESRPASGPPVNRGNVRQRVQPAPSNDQDASASDFNPEHEARCQAILHCKDYYKTLGLEKSCSVEEVKKAYRKLALQFHPDKARCPSAEAAFKELSKAYQCLSEPDARNRYDTYGLEENPPVQSQHYRQQYEAHFMTPEELFESFFGVHFARGPYAQNRVYRTRTHHAQNNTDEPRRSVGFFQFFPLIALLLITILSSFFNSSPSPPFALTRTPEYSVSRVTSEHQLVYFVKPSFHRTYMDHKDRINDLELQIELSHFSSLCEREQNRLLQQLSALKFYGTQEQYMKKSEELRQKEQTSVNCANLRKLKAKYPRQAQQFYRNAQSVWL